MVKIKYFAIFFLLFSAFVQAQTVANVNGTRVNWIHSMFESSKWHHVFKDANKGFESNASKAGYAKGTTYGEKVAVQGIAKKQIATRAVAIRAVALRKIPYASIAYLIGEPLILAGFERLESDLDPDRWWKRNPNNDNRIYYVPADKNWVDPGLMNCILGYAQCIMSSSPSGVCDSGMTAISGSGNTHCAVGNTPPESWHTDNPIFVGVNNLVPASESDLVEGLVSNIYAAAGYSPESLLEAIAEYDPGFLSSADTKIRMKPQTSATSPAYTPTSTTSIGTAGNPQQTNISSNAEGEEKVTYLPRPDLTPGSNEAPNVDPLPLPNPNPDPGTGTGTGSGGCSTCVVIEKIQEIVEKNFCRENPDVLACAKYNTPPIPPIIPLFPDNDINIEIKPDSFLNDSNTCPAPRQMILSIGTGEVSYQPLCDVTSGLKPVFLLACAFIASWVFVRGLNG